MDDKFILVPSDLYKHLIKPDTGEINVENAKRNLSSILNKRKLNKSVQNILYNNELRRFLKVRKEFEDKPVKVELTDGSLMIFNPKQQAKQGKLESEIIAPDKEESELGSVPTIEGDYDTSEEEIDRTPLRRPDFELREREQRPRTNFLLENRRTKLLKILHENPDDFGIDASDQILK